jgi:hypothetical protein
MVKLLTSTSRLSRHPVVSLGCVLTTAILPMVAGAQARPEWLSGSARGGYWSGSRQLDDRDGVATGSIWIKAEASQGHWRTVFDGWLRDDDMGRAGERRGRTREAYLQFDTDGTSIRLGQQLLVWGRADQLNPTDNLTPRDFTLLTTDNADERFGTLALAINHRVGNYTWSTALLPRFRPNVVPWPASIPIGASKPAGGPQVGIKVDHSGASGMDWSASWYSGRDLQPSLKVSPTQPGSVVAVHPRMQVMGADFAVPVGSLGFRGEAAYTRFLDGADQTGTWAKRSFWFAVLGVERALSGTLNVNAQVYLYRVTGYIDPRRVAGDGARQLATAQAVASHQLDRSDLGMTLRIADKWLNETLEGEIVVVSALGRNDWALRPRVTYAFDDHLRLTFGADLFRGSPQAAFGQLRSNSVAFAELRYSW